MTLDRDELCRRAKLFRALHAAFLGGDLNSIRSLLGGTPGFPNDLMPFELGMGDHVLEYAIYWSPIMVIEALLGMGADPNYADQGGFPSLVAALSSERADKAQVLKLLLAAGANPQQRGVNDWTPLHFAVSQDDADLVTVLLDHGADPHARTRIDDYSTPAEEAAAFGRRQALAALERHSKPGPNSTRPKR
jgi:ankyrin repeat protein